MFPIIQKRKFAILPLLVACSALAISVSLLLSTNKFLYFWTFAYALAAYCYFVYSVLDNNLEKGFSNLILLDFFKAIIKATVRRLFIFYIYFLIFIFLKINNLFYFFYFFFKFS